MKLFLRVADLVIGASWEDPRLTPFRNDTAKRFLVEPSPETTSIRLEWDGPGRRTFEKRRLLFDSGGIWKLFEIGGEFEFEFVSPAFGSEPYKRAAFSRDFTSGEVLVNPRATDFFETIDPLEYPVDELLVTNLLARGRGVEIHGCGLIDRDGKGYLFAGQSGDGKTTTANLWKSEPGVRILSDERIVLTEREGRILMHGTPWHGLGRMAEPDGSVVDGIYFLRHGNSFSERTLPMTQSAARLYAACFPPFYSRGGLEFTLEFLTRIASAVACREFHFLPNPEAVAFVRRNSRIGI